MIEINYSSWETQESLFNKYFSEKREYYSCRYGIAEIPVQDIVGLTYKGVLRREKLDKLYNSLMEYGYDDAQSTKRDLNISRYPGGEYCVGSGGNHRAYLSKKLNVKSIKASLEVFLTPSQLTQEEIEVLNSMHSSLDQSNYLKQVVERLKLV